MRALVATLLAIVSGCAASSDAHDGAVTPGDTMQDIGGDAGGDAAGSLDAMMADTDAPLHDIGAPDTAQPPDIGDSATPPDGGAPDGTDAAAPADAGDATGPDADGGAAQDPPLPTELAGRLQVIQGVYEGAPSSAYVSVELWSAPVPSSQVVVDEVGDCKRLEGAITMPWACQPECEWGTALCIDGACKAYPARAPAGPISFEGLSQPVMLTPAADGSYPAEYGLPPTLFTSGDPVIATSPGDVTPALHLSAAGVEPLVAAPDSWSFTPGEDYTVTWTPGDGSARIQLLVNTGWHGSPNLTTIWCETDDDGELTVPASLTAGFPIPSCGECEGSTLSRFTRALVDHGGGPIELFVGSQVWFVAWWGGG